VHMIERCGSIVVVVVVVVVVKVIIIELVIVIVVVVVIFVVFGIELVVIHLLLDDHSRSEAALVDRQH